MPRPLFIYKSVVEQDSSICCEKIENLLGETVEVSDKAHRYLAECIKLLTTKDMCSPMDMRTVDLAVRMWNDLKVSSELTKNGFYLQAMMMERDAIETMAIIEYLHFQRKLKLGGKQRPGKKDGILVLIPLKTKLRMARK